MLARVIYLGGVALPAALPGVAAKWGTPWEAYP